MQPAIAVIPHYGRPPRRRARDAFDAGTLWRLCPKHTRRRARHAWRARRSRQRAAARAPAAVASRTPAGALCAATSGIDVRYGSAHGWLPTWLRRRPARPSMPPTPQRRCAGRWLVADAPKRYAIEGVAVAPRPLALSGWRPWKEPQALAAAALIVLPATGARGTYPQRNDQAGFPIDDVRARNSRTATGDGMGATAPKPVVVSAAAAFA